MVTSKSTNKIGEWIKQQREAAGLFQRELADKLQAYQPDVSKWENGVHMPDELVCHKLAKIFGASVEHVLRMALETNLARQLAGLAA